MASAKGLILSAAGRLVLRDARVARVRELAETLRAIELEGSGLRDAAWTPGDKIQLLLPTLDVRTYTPVSWDAGRGVTELIVFDHGDSPGASWCRRARTGDPCRFVGPQRSLRRAAGRAVVLFGDETSIGVALALVRSQPQTPMDCVFEVGAGSLETTLAELDFEPATVTVVERTAADAHLSDVATRLDRFVRARPRAELVLTGRAQSIQTLRSRLRTAGVRAPGANKAYWAVGKTGLD